MVLRSLVCFAVWCFFVCSLRVQKQIRSSREFATVIVVATVVDAVLCASTCSCHCSIVVVLRRQLALDKNS